MPNRRRSPIIEQLVSFASPEPDTREIETEFYRRLDDAYFYKKAFTLYHVLQNPEGVGRLLASDPAGLAGGDDLTDVLKAEIHLAELDLSESLFAFIAAAFQTAPHPVFMAGYTRELVRWLIDRFIAGDVAALTNEAVRTRGAFIETAIYANLIPGERGPEWTRNIENITRLLEIAGRRYISASELKPLSRGLRIVRDEIETARFMNGPEADAAREGIVDWVAFHRVKRRKDGNKNLYREVKAISFEESINLIYLMTMLMRSLRQTRLARLSGHAKAPIHSLASIEAGAFDQLDVGSEIRTQIGIVTGSDIE
ncbi:MAG: hypothetical protein EXQ99_02435 [Alphaproteobacteria bacterium]|nr:hypothetical protein [Alphaproteobacteria bacterium]